MVPHERREAHSRRSFCSALRHQGLAFSQVRCRDLAIPPGYRWNPAEDRHMSLQLTAHEELAIIIKAIHHLPQVGQAIKGGVTDILSASLSGDLSLIVRATSRFPVATGIQRGKHAIPPVILDFLMRRAKCHIGEIRIHATPWKQIEGEAHTGQSEDALKMRFSRWRTKTLAAAEVRVERHDGVRPPPEGADETEATAHPAYAQRCFDFLGECHTPPPADRQIVDILPPAYAKCRGAVP